MANFYEDHKYIKLKSVAINFSVLIFFFKSHRFPPFFNVFILFLDCTSPETWCWSGDGVIIHMAQVLGNPLTVTVTKDFSRADLTWHAQVGWVTMGQSG